MFVTTLAPITLPCLEKMIFRSVARVNDDSPDTQRLRLAADEDVDDDDVEPVVVAVVDVELLAAADDAVVADVDPPPLLLLLWTDDDLDDLDAPLLPVPLLDVPAAVPPLPDLLPDSD